MIVIASKPGQLGNRLFVFARFVSRAAEDGYAVANPAFDEYADYFRATADDLFCRYPVRKSSLRGGAFARSLLYRSAYYLTRLLVKGRVRGRSVGALALDWEEVLDMGGAEFLTEARRSRALFVQGWLFDDGGALVRQARLVRDFFTPREPFRSNVEALISRARARGDVLVGVHIRHGDYKTFQGGRHFYELEQYAEVMARVGRLFPGRRVCFLVCSNERQDERVLARFDHLPATGHPVEDMYALARCDYIFGPPSTYTMWASFYGEVPLYFIEDPARGPRLEDFSVHLVGHPGAAAGEAAAVGGTVGGGREASAR